MISPRQHTALHDEELEVIISKIKMVLACDSPGNPSTLFKNFYYLECGMIIPHYRREGLHLLRCVMAELSFRTPQAVKIK